MDPCRRRLGLRRPVRVRCTDAVRTPAVYGLLRPAVLLPRETVDRLDARDLEGILLHELVHLRRRDLWINAWCVIARTVHWFNPILALIFRRMRHDRELATDAAVLAATGGDRRTAYGEAILRLLEAPDAAHPLPGLVGILEDQHQLQDPIRRISGYRPLRRFSVAGLGLVAALAVTALTNAVTPEPNPEAEASGPDRFDLSVKDETTGEPIPGARVQLVAEFENERGAVLSGETDALGRCSLSMPRRSDTWFGSVAVGVVAEGHAVQQVKWDLTPGAPLPEGYTLHLSRGISMGGTVSGRDGQPVEDAEISFSLTGPDPPCNLARRASAMARPIPCSTTCERTREAGGSSHTFPRMFDFSA